MDHLWIVLNADSKTVSLEWSNFAFLTRSLLILILLVHCHILRSKCSLFLRHQHCRHCSTILRFYQHHWNSAIAQDSLLNFVLYKFMLRYKLSDSQGRHFLFSSMAMCTGRQWQPETSYIIKSHTLCICPSIVSRCVDGIGSLDCYTQPHHFLTQKLNKHM